MTLTILLIDDDERVLHAFARNARLTGHTVIEALGGQAGLELYYQTQPDVVLTDLRMPAPDGLAVLQAIRQHDPEANVILLSGHGDQEAILAAMRSGASDFLPKPVDQVTLETVLRRAEERSHLKRELRASQEALRQQNALLEETVRARTAELEETLAKYRVLFDAFPLGITIAAADGQILEGNREAERLLGVSAAEHTERSIDGAEWRVIRPDGSPMPTEEYASVRALQERQLVRNVEMGIVKGAADVTWISVTAAPLGDDRVAITYNDVSKRKQAQDALQKNLERYRKAQQLGQVGNWEYDLQTTEFWGSEEAKRIYGFDPVTERFIMEEVEQCIPERERVHQALVDLIERDAPYHIVFDIITKDTGERRSILSKAELQRDAAGVPLKISGVIQNITERKQAEEALQQSAAALQRQNELFAALLDNLQVGVFMVEAPSGKPLIANAAAEKLLGKGILPDADKTTLAEVYHARKVGQSGPYPVEELPIVRGMYGESVSVDDMVVDHPGGAEILLEVFGAPIKDEQGVIWASLTSFHDITARKRTEAALHESEARYRLIAENIADSIWAMDAERRFTYLSPSTERLFGYTLQEWQSPAWTDFVHPAYLDTINIAFESLSCGKDDHVTAVIQVYRKEGQPLWVEFRATASWEPDGAFAGVVGVTRDITARKQAEAAVLRERERLDNILSALDTGLTLLNPDMTIAWVNQKIRLMFPHAEPLGQLCHRFYEGRDIPCEHCRTRLAFQTEQVEIHERQNPATGRWYTIVAQPVTDQHGNVTQVLEGITDITERKTLELQLQEYAANLEMLVRKKVQELELERAKVIQAGKLAALGELATGVAHELNQPLTSLLLDVDYLEALAACAQSGQPEHALPPETLLELVGHQRRDIARCRRIIDHLRMFGRISNEPPAPVGLNEVLADTFILIEQRLRQHDVTVEFALTEPLPPVLAHSQKLEQVFLNLISNAEYAMSEMARCVQEGEVEYPGYEKTLHIRSYAEGDRVCIAIRDNGSGMTPEQQARLFEPFFTTKPVGQGTGLGLSISYGIVADSGGEIRCESAVNEGTTFTVCLPRVGEG